LITAQKELAYAHDALGMVFDLERDDVPHDDLRAHRRRNGISYNAARITATV